MKQKMLLIFIFLSVAFNIGDANECVSYNFECTGSSSKSPNCFRCKDITKNEKEKWDLHVKTMLKLNSAINGKSWWYQFHANISKNGIYCCNPGTGDYQCYKSLSFSRDYIPFFHMGCSKTDKVSKSFCDKNKSNRCCSENHCNLPDNNDIQYLLKDAKEIFPSLNHLDETLQYNINIIYAVVILLVLFLLVIFIYLYCKSTESKHCISYALKIINIRCQKKMRNSKRYTTEEMEIPNDSIENSCSGSGAGAPILTVRTTSMDVSLIHPVGEGRFGTVWLGKWDGDDVAVKIFSSRDERSWAREKKMYRENGLRHANILGFITADSRDNGLSTELWLITEFHEHGSLFKVLKSETVEVENAVKMVRSITNGLAYLHWNINGIVKKPSIAHRDLKSRNILVKSCGECCIGDLGLAVYLNEDDNKELIQELISDIDLMMKQKNSTTQDQDQLIRVAGTKRYMAPEILNGSLQKLVKENLVNRKYNKHNLEYCMDAFKKADIYSYSLVLWEIISRTKCEKFNIIPQQYEMPYQNEVSSDPSIKEMCQIVCVKNIRPNLSEVIEKFKIANDVKLISILNICEIISECWFSRPTTRLNINRLKKTMSDISNTLMDNSNKQEVRSQYSQHQRQPLLQSMSASITNDGQNELRVSPAFEFSSQGSTTDCFNNQNESNAIPNVDLSQRFNKILPFS